MINKTAIVTGSSSGFGYVTVIELAKAGFHVVATMRDLTKSAQLEQELNSHNLLEQVDIEYVDVTSQESINKLVEKCSKYNSVDLLVNNAGFAVGGFAEEVTIDEYRKQFETNVFGLMAMTQAVLPIMRKQRSGRIINMSSVSGLIGFPSISAYVSSKFAVEGYSESLRIECKPFGIDIVLIEPGSYATNVWKEGRSNSTGIGNEDSPYATHLAKIEERLAKEEKNLGNPLDVAKLVVSVANKHNPKLRYKIGKGIKMNVFMKHLIPWNIWEKIILRLLYK
ncbi:SDR family oxidoreductase [Bacillus sp. SCS-151]|uniref:SDR family oxidoreductase n=1 Tax=Nanhaiella sioensis TaxID=3115293 RepID=UPI00397E14B7